MNIPRPYKEKRENGNLVREFSSDSNPDDLVWHKDKQGRIVTVVKSNGWKLQMESGLPFDLTEGKNYKIPALSWHRILKGRGNLLIKIKESNKNSLLQIFESDDSSYRGEHLSPSIEDAPLYDLTKNGVYPDDVYQNHKLYSYDDLESTSWSIVLSNRGRPNAKIKIYRAVPKILTAQEELELIEYEMKYILKYGKIPPTANTSKNRNEYYDELHERKEDFLSNPKTQTETKNLTISPGDWVSIDRSYAVDHGNSNLGGKGKYRILTKTVPAKHIFTDGNSIVEWGYSPS